MSKYKGITFYPDVEYWYRAIDRAETLDELKDIVKELIQHIYINTVDDDRVL